MTRATTIAGAVTAAVVVALGALLAPHPATLGDASGDDALAARTRDALGRGHHAVSVALVEPDGVRYAGFGANEHTPYEIGSVAKVMTSMLLSDAVARGEVTLEEPLGDHLDLGDSPAADVTLAELASHRSGLPRMGGGLWGTAGAAVATLRHRNPYYESVDDLVAEAREASVGDERGSVSYSNLGGALLGQALAARSGLDYAALLRTRLLEPLGLTDTTVPEDDADATTHGRAASGLAEEPWVQDGYAPAGGIRSTTADLAVLIGAVLDRSAPGADAVEPRWDAADGDRIGLAWFTSADGTTWHNGGTGGYRAMVALDRTRGRGVVVLADTAIDVDDAALDILEGTR
ncbi:serine hydrolase domain-containing protein [Mumia sp. Pv 4-285]|uniref:serine hydrolase domain-containing protein n=1 Tax=Mumia qirimensis TaxID=3234852 RepID=UPI00351D41CD